MGITEKPTFVTDGEGSLRKQYCQSCILWGNINGKVQGMTAAMFNLYPSLIPILLHVNNWNTYTGRIMSYLKCLGPAVL